MMGSPGKPPGGEELAALQEELAAARADVERLQADAANASARAEQAVAESDTLRDDVRSSGEAAALAAAESAALRERLADAESRMRTSAERYRDLVVRTDPALPAELIAGETVDDVDASVEAARAMVSRVRSHIEAQAQAARVPAGAPPRAAPDVGALSPEQKIRYGLSRRS
jgi:chromosome segregation ATPase